MHAQHACCMRIRIDIKASLRCRVHVYDVEARGISATVIYQARSEIGTNAADGDRMSLILLDFHLGQHILNIYQTLSNIESDFWLQRKHNL